MEYKALTQNTSIFTKTITINTTTVLSDPLRYMFGTFRGVDSSGNKLKPCVFAPYSYQNYYSGSKPTIQGTSSSGSYYYDPTLYSCEIDGITYWGTKRASFYFPFGILLKGIIKIIMYSSTEGTIVPNEYKVDLKYDSSGAYSLFLMIPKLSEDIILSIVFEEETTETTSE